MLLTGVTMKDTRPVAGPPNLGATKSYFCTLANDVHHFGFPAAPRRKRSRYNSPTRTLFPC
jgi:hypothetical protein